MEKMSEVFKMPVKAALMDNEHAQEILQSGESHYCLEDGAYWMASNIEHIEAAANAINHVDAIADALELMIQHNWHPAQFRREAELAATKALAAYRGEK